MQRQFELTVRENGGAVLHPSYIGDVDEKFLVGFFGLDKPDVESYEIREVKFCCICGKHIDGHGHNASPIKDGTCCDECNMTKVIPERIKMTKDNDTGKG